VSESDLAICLEAIRRGLVYAEDLEEWREHPRKVGSERGKISVEGLKNALKAIAEHCPIPPYDKERFEEWVARAEESPWQTVATYGMDPRYVKNSLLDVIRKLAEKYGFRPGMYEPYIPK